ncbi:sodium/hydrogen exchanger 1-like [Phragmites australis]|uniref:sodium/hydrogen exchanger 1-like n=1 Tax=Phragmites australis TaxID=29695 RepID=UPI002D76646A|nr:sodium/hydrogen exchanger 1-like [Phragmites australis]
MGMGVALGDPQADYDSIAAVGLFVALMCVCIIVGHLLEENRWMNESTTALFIGLGTGTMILLASSGKHSHVLVFSEDLFFIYLLPPIIFNAGFQVKKKQFFRNFITITLFGVVGTLISFTVISLGALGLISRLNIGSLELGDYLALGAIFSATDSVCTLQVLNQDETPFLYSLVFGEGVVNDATSVVLFNAIQNFDLGSISSAKLLKFIGSFLYLFSSSTILGVAAGLLSAYVIKKLYFGRHSTDREVSIMMLMAYLSYMLAELLDLSGILTVFFCGIVMSHYTWHNVTESSRVTTKHAFATLSFISETFLFLYVGMDALDIEKWKIVRETYSPMKSIALSSTILALVLVARAAFVFPLSFLSNWTKKTPGGKISIKQQVIVWWAGLMRGAVSIALAYNKFASSGHTQLPSNAIMITSTISVVLFSTIVFGLLTKPLIRLLIPARHLSREPSALSEPSSPKSFLEQLIANSPDADLENCVSLRRPTSLRLLLQGPSRSVHHYWRKFDDAFMRPVFGGRGFVPFVPGSPTESSVPLLPGTEN